MRRGSFAAVCAVVALVGSSLIGNPATASARSSVGCSSSAVSGPSRVGRIGGIVHPQRTGATCTDPLGAGLEDPYYKQGNPPLLDHGGKIMSTQSTGDQVVVTPIFWEPSGFTFTTSYKSTITAYLDDLAADSGKLTNVFSTMFQYSGSNGGFNYKMSVGTPIDDTSAFPTAGCSTNAGNVYSDNTGYTTCLDDDQVQTESGSVVASHSLPTGLGHMYVMFLPKHVETCFFPGNPSNQACSINSTASAAFCAYHSAFGSAASPVVYANMPFPIYSSATLYSCTTETLGGGIQSPNGNTDADVEISPLSHEMAEAMTDPDVQSGWYDASGNENGDDCAYIYGTLSGAAGVHYNQTINGDHYLTQEEFSNQDFVPNTSGCLQRTAAVTPTVALLSSTGGPTTGGGHLTITGTGFPGASAVHFGATSTTYTVLDATHIQADIPAGSGVVDVEVSTSAGTSTATALDHYTYAASGSAPTVTGVSPTQGPTAGGQRVTITGTGFASGATVAFGSSAGTAVTVVSPTSITVTTPAHAKGTVDVKVTTSGGPSTTTTGDRYTYLVRPKVTALSRHSGTHNGGTKVTITGSGFAPGSTVRFGSTRGTHVTVVSSTKITVVSPRHAKGKVDIRVKNPGGTSATSSADRYTFT